MRTISSSSADADDAAARTRVPLHEPSRHDGTVRATETASSTTRRHPRFRVAILQKDLLYYRASFYPILERLLAEDGIELRLIHGRPLGAAVAKKASTELPGSIVIDNRVIRVGPARLLWQPCLGLLRDCDLVIAEQASKLLVNYILHLESAVGLRKFALWGHGRNLQAHGAHPLAERLKRLLLRQCDWWFAYTDDTKTYLERAGVAPERITAVQNAVNSRAFLERAAALDASDLGEIRERLNLRSPNVALFIGSFYPEKRLDFLISACRFIRERVPDFEIVFAGAGPQSRMIEEACARNPFMHCPGPVREDQKIGYFAVAKLLLMPGLVGLVSAEAINFGVPLITVDLPYHSPEIAYLRDRVNGVLLPERTTPQEYAAVVAAHLEDEVARARLRDACLAERYRYTTDEMAARFAAGIRQCLGVAGARPPAARVM